MNSPFNRAMNDAMRIVRTEGHRIQQEGFLDAGNEAKKVGADVLKQWDATLDSLTRPWHQEADGQIVEWGEKFKVNGEEMDAPGVDGSASNVINYRCQLLQRARWMLTEKELERLQEGAEFFGLDKAESFEEFKEKYLKLADNSSGLKMDLQFFARIDDAKAQELENEFLRKLNAGLINTKIRREKQNEHIEGTSERERRIEEDAKHKKTPSSQFYANVNIEELLKKYSGKGCFVFTYNNEYPTEYITVDNNIGDVYNLGDGRYHSTDRIAIRYSSKGVHLHSVKNWEVAL